MGSHRKADTLTVRSIEMLGLTFAKGTSTQGTRDGHDREVQYVTHFRPNSATSVTTIDAVSAQYCLLPLTVPFSCVKWISKTCFSHPQSQVKSTAGTAKCSAVDWTPRQRTRPAHWRVPCSRCSSCEAPCMCCSCLIPTQMKSAVTSVVSCDILTRSGCGFKMRVQYSVFEHAKYSLTAILLWQRSICQLPDGITGIVEPDVGQRGKWLHDDTGGVVNNSKMFIDGGFFTA